MNKPFLGVMPCHVCGATVEVKRNAGRKAYYYCNGNADGDGRACGSDMRVGVFATTQLYFARATEGENDDETEPENPDFQGTDAESAGESVGGDYLETDKEKETREWDEVL